MVNHTGFVFLRNKETGKIEMFYCGNEPLLNNFSEEELANYDKTPIPFEAVDYDTLVELLGNIYEDRNWHKSLRPVSILSKVVKSCTDKKTAENIIRKFILEIETIS